MALMMNEQSLSMNVYQALVWCVFWVKYLRLNNWEILREKSCQELFKYY